jgi:hypothetical protein
MMAKKMVSLFVLAAFALFNLSCFTPHRSASFQKTVKTDAAEVDRTNRKLRIINVITKTGENIAFRKNDPGNFVPGGEAVVGTTLKELEFDKKDIKISYKGKAKRITTVETANGRFYKVLSSTEEADKVRIKTYAPVTIPFTDSAGLDKKG